MACALVVDVRRQDWQGVNVDLENLQIRDDDGSVGLLGWQRQVLRVVFGELPAHLPGGVVLWWSDARSWALRVPLAKSLHLAGMALWDMALADRLPGGAPQRACTTPARVR